MNTYIDVTYSGNTGKITVKPQYQYNQGQQLRVHGIGEDVNVFMHYAVRGLTKPIVRFPSFEEDAWVSFVPNALLAQSSPIVAYVYITSANSAQTVYEIEIPIIKRPMPDGFEMEDDEIADIQQMIADLREVAEDAKEAQAIIDDLRAALREAESLANLSVSAVSLAADQEAYATLSKDEGENQHIEFGIPAGKQGKEGIPGKDATHSWNGTILTVTSASGTSSSDLKGDPGVQISDTEPTDPNVTVWVNPKGEADSTGITDEQIKAAIDEYLKNNPIDGTVTDEQIANAVSDYLLENPIDTGVNEEQLNQAVTAALNEAKESGLFNGKDGDPGPQGPKGDSYTLTDADKQEIAEQAADLMELPIDDTTPSSTSVYSSEKVDSELNQLSEQTANYRTAVNLLRNGDFQVAQAGYGGMHGNTRYVCDMWYNRFGFGEFSFDKSNGLTMVYKNNHAYACQKIENDDLYVGKPLTFAVCLSDGTIHVCSGVYTKTTATAIKDANSLVIGIYDDGEVRIIVLEGGMTIKWAALYEGEYTAETLPPYVPKGYAAELAACNVADTGCVERTLIQENTTYVATGFPANPTTASNTVYTTPADGIFYLFATRGETAGNTIRVYILKPSGETVAQFNIPAYYPYAMCCLTIPVKRGMEIKVDADSASATWMIREQKFFY